MARQAFLMVWLALSAGAALPLLAPHFVPPAVILDLAGKCRLPAEQHHRDCPVCGMTRAFLLISDGRLAEAAALNPGAVPLFVAILLNEALVVCHFSRRVCVRWLGTWRNEDGHSRGRGPAAEEQPCKC